MTLPSLLFAVLIASLYGAVYHLIRDGGPGQLLIYLLMAWAGFAVGHLLGVWRGWILLPVGPLNLGMATLGSLLVLVGGDVVGRVSERGIHLFPDDENRV